MGGREVIFEFRSIGNSVKVSAIDSETQIEVSIVGPTSASEASLRATALRKLDRAIARAREAGKIQE
ncbi:MAG: serine hydroxymethyltransferase [Rhodospirillales bacterium]|nr:serine hydroxymethyltransferase [Rhodospirillales bacterium]